MLDSTWPAPSDPAVASRLPLSRATAADALPRRARRLLRSLWSARRTRVSAAVVVPIAAVAVGALALSTVRGEFAAPAMVLGVVLAAAACEFVDSSLGMGYGTTLTPLLLLAGFEPLEIVPAVLTSECLTGLAAGLMHHRDGNVDFVRNPRAWQTTLLLLALTLVGAAGAAVLAVHISKFWMTAMIGAIVLGVGVMILATARRQLRYRPLHIVLLGGLAAFNKGLSGGGYGPLVTGGQVVAGISPRQAVAITSLAEGVTCLIGLAVYVLLAGWPAWGLALPLTGGALLTVPLATLVVRRLPETGMRRAVGVLTAVLGAVTLGRLLF